MSSKVTYIRNGCLAWVAYSQGRALDDSRAILVIESGPSIVDKICVFWFLNLPKIREKVRIL